MKELKIYSADEVQEPLILKLFHNESDVNLIAVDLDGCPILAGSLLSITSNGFLRLSDHISEDLELPLDEDGRLKIAGRKDKTAVTFSDDELISITRMRNRLKSEWSKADAYCVTGENLIAIEKMIEALNLPMSDDDEE